MITTEHLTDKYLLLHCDVLYANNLPLVISVAKPLNLLLCSELSERSSKCISRTILSHMEILKQQRFVINKIMADSESGLVGCTVDLNRESIELVLAATGKHVNVTERAIREIKERARCILAELPWKMPVSWTK